MQQHADETVGDSVPAEAHVPQEPYDPTQGWDDPVPTTLTCGCGEVFTGADLIEATAALNAHQVAVVAVGTVMDSSRPLPAGQVCEVCEVAQARVVVMGPAGPYACCGAPVCG